MEIELDRADEAQRKISFQEEEERKKKKSPEAKWPTSSTIPLACHRLHLRAWCGGGKRIEDEDEREMDGAGRGASPRNTLAHGEREKSGELLGKRDQRMEVVNKTSKAGRRIDVVVERGGWVHA